MNNDPYQIYTQQQQQQPVAPPQPGYNNFIIPPPVKKPSKAPLIITIVLGVLLFAAIGFIAYLLFFQPKATTPAATDTPNKTVVDTTKKAGDAGKVIESIQAALTQKITPNYKETTIETGTLAPAYTAKDEPFAVMGKFGSSLAINPSPAKYDDKANKAVQDVIIDTLGATSRFNVTTTDWNKTYQDDTVICSVSTSSAPVTVNCANIADYKDSAAKAKPFATAYLNSADGKKYGKGLLLGDITVTQKTGGYSHATVAMGNTLSPYGGFVGLFYAKDGHWTYFRGTQSILLCSDYNTYDIQAAFEGDTCYNAADNDTTATLKITLTK